MNDVPVTTMNETRSSRKEAPSAGITPSGMRESATMMTSWKDIAQYFGRSVRTVQRWECEFGLPIRRRRDGLIKGSIVAIPTEIEAWIQKRYLPRPYTRRSPRQPSIELDIASRGPSEHEVIGMRPESPGLRG